MIALLDLNFTLVENSRERRSPFSRQIEAERYRLWLLRSLQGLPVLLVTARPDRYEAETLASIAAKCEGWQPVASYFNPGMHSPPIWKSWAWRKVIAPRFGDDPAAYIAIESNPATRAAYAKLGIRAVTQEEVAACPTILQPA